MRDEVVDDSLASLELIPYWFVTSKMIKNLFTALHADENIPYFNEDPDNVVFFCNEMSILNIDLNNINLLMKIILILSFLSDFWLVILNLKNTKKIKKTVKNYCKQCGILTDGGTFACQKMRKKGMEPISLSNAFNVYNLRVLEQFST